MYVVLFLSLKMIKAHILKA